MTYLKAQQNRTMKFKIGDTVKLKLNGIIGTVAEVREGRKKNTYKILIANNFILCNEEDLIQVP
jgi:heat shock protein HspQ